MPLNLETKQIVKTALLTAVLTVLVLLLANYALTRSWGLSLGSKQPFTVQGSSTISAEPDQASIYFTVMKTNESLTTAQNESNTFINTIMIDLEKVGIAKEDIKTENYNSYPNTENYNPYPDPSMPIPQPSQTIISYTVSQNINITIHDTTKINDVVDTVTKDGAENIYGPNFTFSDAKQKELANEARTQAIADAKQKAQTIASAAGIRLGRITNVQEDSAGNPVPAMYDTKTLGMGGGESAPTQINPGQTTFTKTVTLYYNTW